MNKLQREVIALIEKRKAEWIACSDSIWSYAEASFQEVKSTQFLKEIFKKEGFKIEENVCGVSTQFIASYGHSKPVIALFGEYDADPNASNKVVPRKEALQEGALGHGGGHNLLGVGSLATTLIIKELIQNKKINCTIRYYGTTDEGGLGSKTYLARDGYFDDLDISLYWHPSPVTTANASNWDAMIEFEVAFKGTKSNAFLAPEKGINALEITEQFIQEVKNLKKQINEDIIMNHIIPFGGDDLQYIPDSTHIRFRIQYAKQEVIAAFFEKIKELAKKITHINKAQVNIQVIRAKHQMIHNLPALKMIDACMQAIGAITYTSEEQQYAREMQKYLNLEEKGMDEKILPFSDTINYQTRGYASDIGDASWFAPEVYFVTTTLPFVPMHTWAGTAFTAHSIGHKGMLYATKVMALFIINYLENQTLQENIQKEFEQQTHHYHYKSFLR
ncbi:MAG: peptidase dimerization domain-containing protein [Microscillaceae bacterium]|nr:peptidase dimerization domain-containing protein [Microscillaceae bacterium]